MSNFPLLSIRGHSFAVDVETAQMMCCHSEAIDKGHSFLGVIELAPGPLIDNIEVIPRTQVLSAQSLHQQIYL